MPTSRDRTNNLNVPSQFEALIEEATSLCPDPSRAATMQEEMREGLLGTPRKRIELVITNAEVFLGNAIRQSQRTQANPAKWTILRFATTEAPIGPADPIPLTPPADSFPGGSEEKD